MTRSLFLRNADLLAGYNAAFNADLHRALARSARLPQALADQMGHLLFMDYLWLARLGCEDARACDVAGTQRVAVVDRERWYRDRRAADEILSRFIGTLQDDDLERSVAFITQAEQAKVECKVWAALSHLFNHQSLHRGEMLRLLTDMGLHFGNSDLLPLIVEVVPRERARETA